MSWEFVIFRYDLKIITNGYTVAPDPDKRFYRDFNITTRNITIVVDRYLRVETYYLFHVIANASGALIRPNARKSKKDL